MGTLIELYPACLVCGAACWWRDKGTCPSCAEWRLRQLIQIEMRRRFGEQKAK